MRRACPLPIRLAVMMIAAFVANLAARPLAAQDNVTNETPSKQLERRQTELADKYQRLETLMLKMSEFHADSDPRRAALLKQALGRSKDRQVSAQMQELVRSIEQQHLKEAVAEQSEVRDSLAQILELLLSEDRADRLKDEQNRIKSYIKEVERLIRQQRGILGRTEGGDDTQRLGQEQANTADKAERLATDIEQNERTPGANGAESSSSDADGEKKDANDTESPEGEAGKSSDGGEAKDGESNSESPSSEDQQGDAGKESSADASNDTSDKSGD